MNILEVSDTGGVGTGHMGPVTNVVYQLVNSFALLGQDIKLVDAKSVKKRTLHQDVKLIETNTTGWPRNSEWPVLKQFVKELVALDLSNFDIIHVHSRPIAQILYNKYGVKCVYTSHTPTWCDPSLNPYEKFKNILQILRGNHEYNVIKKLDLTIALGDFLKKSIKGAKITVIPNGIDARQYIYVNNSRSMLDLSEDKFIVLFVGRFVPIKGVHVLLEAINSLNLDNLRVIIIGRTNSGKGMDEYAESLNKIAQDLPVQFTGFISNKSETFSQYLSAADLLVVPSLFDNQASVVLEGLAMNLPVIASKVGGISQMINNNVGMLFEPGNSEELSELISYLYKNPDVCRRMSKNAREHVEANFNWENCAKKHLAAFRNVIQ